MSKSSLKSLLALGLLIASQAALAVPCGTVASPTACSISVSGSVTYDLTNFDFVNSTSSGSGNLYGADDIAINVSAAGSSGLEVTFSKTGPTPGVVFFANAGETSSFVFSYDLAASSMTLGTASFSSTTTSLVGGRLGNGFSSVQQIVVDGGGTGTSCMAITVTQPSLACPLADSSPVTVGNIVNLFGGTGNTSILNFKNIFDVSFSTTPPPTNVPEPASLWLFAAALTALVVARSRRRV
jgi:hypothetical protein